MPKAHRWTYYPRPRATISPKVTRLVAGAIVIALFNRQTSVMTHLSAQFELPDEAATAALGELLASVCQPGDVIALSGDLGTGKTTLARALIRALTSADTEVPSPTYTLVQTYTSEAFEIWHFDLYRIEDRRELTELGFEETVDGLVLIEWPDRMGPDLPKMRLEVELLTASDGRIAHLADHHDWSKRIDGDWR